MRADPFSNELRDAGNHEVANVSAGLVSQLWVSTYVGLDGFILKRPVLILPSIPFHR